MWKDRGVAVTQQLARLTYEALAECRSSIDALDRLCSFELRTREDYLDLDWSPRPLELLAAKVDAELSAAIRDACSGGDEINPAYREFPGSIVEHPVRALEPDAVRGVAATLTRIEPEGLVAVLPPAAEAARHIVGMEDFLGHPGDHLRGHYDSLRRFYEAAAARGQVTASWWD